MKLNNDNSKKLFWNLGFRSILSLRMTPVNFCSPMASLSFFLSHYILGHDKFTTLLRNSNFSTTKLIPSNYLELHQSVNCIRKPMCVVLFAHVSCEWAYNKHCEKNNEPKILWRLSLHFIAPQSFSLVSIGTHGSLHPACIQSISGKRVFVQKAKKKRKGIFHYQNS